jgi:primosomal protein N' (replication factor Y)
MEQMETALAQKEQVILFQNRRGFSPFVECDVCGWVPRCKFCDVSMTYHKKLNQLVCHYCGHTVTTPQTCQACGSPGLSTKGFGTEKIEEEIKLLFPDIRVGRMDYDTTRTKKSYQQIISDFETGSVDILIGTQMVSKGLDFDKVSVVGILNADNMLNIPDFRAFERGFQMMAQVSGRAGRKKKQGTVVLQTANPDHPVIQYVIDNDYESMYRSQIEERQIYKYPPFYRLLHILLRHKDKKTLDSAADTLAGRLRAIMGERILGPQEPPVSRVRNQFITRIIIKFEKGHAPSYIKQLINDSIDEVLSRQQWRYVTIQKDVDPL